MKTLNKKLKKEREKRERKEGKTRTINRL